MSPSLLLLAAGPKPFTQPRLEVTPEPWVFFLVVILVLAFAGACYLLERRGERRWLRPVLAVLRAAVILLAIVILLRPLLSKELREEKLGQVVVVLDTSRSMAFEDREKDEALRDRVAAALGTSAQQLRTMTRLDRVKAALRKDDGAFLRGLAEKNKVRLYTFDATRTKLAEVDKLEADGKEVPGTSTLAAARAELEGLAAEGQSTALGDSLQRILGDLRNERVAALVLLTDGRSNGGSVSAPSVAARFGHKGVKVFAVGVGDPDPPRDLAVDDFRAPDVSLAGDVLAGSLVVRAQGYTERRPVTVTITIDGAKVSEQTGEVGGDRPQWEVQFDTKVTRPGEYTLEAKVTPDPDELTDQNNRAIRRVRVIDERIRVLYVEGYPRWEYRYIKNALVRDRHMEVQCLLASADPGFTQESSAGVPPLHRLPPPEELLKYHVVILGDVKPDARDREGNLVFYDKALDTLKELVKERGGGLLMISGSQASPRLYAGTPVADLLPIEIDESAFVAGDYKRAYRPQLTREGRNSPLMRLEADDRLNRELWDRRLQGLYWYSTADRAKPQARVLAVHPRVRNQHGPLPLLAWHRYGAGTVFWMGIDETWRWRAEVGDKYPYRFYGQILRFLSLQSFTRSKRFYITTDKTEYDVGEEVRIRAEVRDDQARQTSGPEAKQKVLADLPNGDTQAITLSGLEGEPGKYEGTLKPVQTGPYKLYVEAGDRFGADEIANRVFEVKLPRLELQDPRMDKEGLERVAAESGGQFLRLDGLAKIPDQLTPLSEPILMGKEELDLWDQPWVFALFCALLVCEWIGRKASRLL
ncbi:MAG: VWA domain-containing protein [Planctomycetota bacterium]